MRYNVVCCHIVPFYTPTLQEKKVYILKFVPLYLDMSVKVTVEAFLCITEYFMYWFSFGTSFTFLPDGAFVWNKGMLEIGQIFFSIDYSDFFSLSFLVPISFLYWKNMILFWHREYNFSLLEAWKHLKLSKRRKSWLSWLLRSAMYKWLAIWRMYFWVE